MGLYLEGLIIRGLLVWGGYSREGLFLGISSEFYGTYVLSMHVIIEGVQGNKRRI